MNVRTDDPDELRDVISALEAELEERTTEFRDSEKEKEKMEECLDEIQEELDERNKEVKMLANAGAELSLELQECEKYIGALEDKLSLGAAEIRKNLIGQIGSLAKQIAIKENEIGRLIRERNEKPVSGSPANIMLENQHNSFQIQFDLNVAIAGVADELTDPIYEIGCDNYDGSIEVHFSEHLDPDWAPTQKFLDTVVNKIGFAHGWLNFLDGSEIHFSSHKGKFHWGYNSALTGKQDRIAVAMVRYMEEYHGVRNWSWREDFVLKAYDGVNQNLADLWTAKLKNNILAAKEREAQRQRDAAAKNETSA